MTDYKVELTAYLLITLSFATILYFTFIPSVFISVVLGVFLTVTGKTILLFLGEGL